MDDEQIKNPPEQVPEWVFDFNETNSGNSTQFKTFDIVGGITPLECFNMSRMVQQNQSEDIFNNFIEEVLDGDDDLGLQNIEPLSLNMEPFSTMNEDLLSSLETFPSTMQSIPSSMDPLTSTTKVSSIKQPISTTMEPISSTFESFSSTLEPLSSTTEPLSTNVDTCATMEPLSSNMESDQELQDIFVALEQWQDQEKVPTSFKEMQATSVSSSQSSSSSQSNNSSPSNEFCILPMAATLQASVFSSPKLMIILQPECTFRFRYASEVKDPHGYLGGSNSMPGGGRSLKCHTTVELHLPPTQDSSDLVDDEFFIRCTLHQYTAGSDSGLIVPLSPHQLCRRVDGVLKDETELNVCRKVAQNIYSFSLENFLIIHTPTDSCQEVCLNKYRLLSEQNAVLGSNLSLSVGEEAEFQSKTPGTKNKEKIKQSMQVKIAFEAFQRSNDGSYTSIAGPIFSTSITHGEPLKIARICKLNGWKDEVTEVTLLVSALKTFDIRICLRTGDSHCNIWQKHIDLEPKMVHQKCAITFEMPAYAGPQVSAENIKCEIQLQRLSDGARSNIVTFNYISGLKRMRVLKESRADTIASKRFTADTRRPVHTSDVLLSLESDAVTLTDSSDDDISSSGIRSNIAEGHDTVVLKSERQKKDNESQIDLNAFERALCLNNTKDLEEEELRVLNESKIFYKNNETISEKLNAILMKVLMLYKEFKDKAILNKSEYSEKVRQHFIYFEYIHPDGDSILHYILADEVRKMYENEFYKVIVDFQLEDFISQSRNVYGETALMYACMYRRTFLASALINMGSSIAAENVETGNNVMHLVMQPGQEEIEECRNILLKSMKRSKKNADSFVCALGSYNLNGLTPLHLAAMQNNVSLMVKLLRFCKKQAALDLCCRSQLSDGNTILHLAAVNGMTDLYARILERTEGSILSEVVNYAGYTAAEMLQIMEKEEESAERSEESEVDNV